MSTNSTPNATAETPVPEAVLEHLRRLEARQSDLETRQKSLQSNQTYIKTQVDVHLQHQTHFNRTTQTALDLFASNMKSIEALASQLQNTLPLLQHVSLALAANQIPPISQPDMIQMASPHTPEPPDIDTETRPRKQRLTESSTPPVPLTPTDAAHEHLEASPMNYE